MWHSERKYCVIESLRSDKSRFDLLVVELQSKEETYKSLYQKLPVAEENNDSITQIQVQQEKEAYIGAKSTYNNQFDGIVGDFLSSESYRFEGENKDFADLVAHLLPDIFKHERVIEEDVISKIESTSKTN